MLGALACPATTQCTVLGGRPDVTTFNPLAAAFPAAGARSFPVAVNDLVCPAITLCLAGEGGIAFNPDDPQHASTIDLQGLATNVTEYNGLPSGGPLSDVTCVSSQSCFAVDEAAEVYPFDPLAPAPILAQTPDPNYKYDGVFGSQIDCPTAGECVLIDGDGELTFDPAAPSTGQVAKPLPLGSLAPIACPTADQCTLVDTVGAETTFDPNAPTIPARQEIDAHGGGVNWVACPSTTQCTMIDNEGGEVTFDPTDPQGAPRVEIDPTGHQLIAIACPSTTQCTLIDAANQELTFDPTAPSTPAPYPAQTFLGGLAGSVDGSWHFHPRLVFSLLAGDSRAVDDVRSVAVTLPDGLYFESLRSIRQHAIVKADGRETRYAARLERGTLTIALPSATADLRVQIPTPALRSTGALRAARRHHTRRHLRFELLATTASGATTSIPMTLPVNQPAFSELGSHCSFYPITTSNPATCD